MSKIVLVGGTHESYKSPKTFVKAWNHEDNYLRGKWIDAIKEELEHLEKNKVWRVMTKDQVPADRRLLGTRWLFKVKKNGIFEARLVA